MSDAPRYPRRSNFQARVSSSEDVPDDAATALDRVRFTEDMLAAPLPAVSRHAGTGTTRAHATRAPSSVRWAIAAVLFLGPVLGALFGYWLASR